MAKKERKSLAEKMMKFSIGDYDFMDVDEIGAEDAENLDTLLDDIPVEDGEVKVLVGRKGTGIFEVPLDRIDPPKFHDRVYIPKAFIMKLSESLKNHGQIQPVLLRVKGDRFERIAGHLRIEAAKLLGWKKILAYIVDVDDATAFRMMVAENQYRENLSDYDKIVTALYAIELLLGLKPEEVKKFYYLLSNKETGRNKQPITEKEIKMRNKIVSILGDLNISGWDTFGAMLKLYFSIHPKVKDLMVKNSWKYYVAYEINKASKQPELFSAVLRLIEGFPKTEDGKVPLSLSDAKAIIRKARGLLSGDTGEEIFPYASFSENMKQLRSLTHKIRKRWSKLSEDERAVLDEEMMKVQSVLDQAVLRIKSVLEKK